MAEASGSIQEEVLGALLAMVLLAVEHDTMRVHPQPWLAFVVLVIKPVGANGAASEFGAGVGRVLVDQTVLDVPRL